VLGGAPVALGDVECRPRRVAVGVFDGVHLGHREVVRGSDCALTFDPHPRAVLAPEHAPPLLTTVARRAELLTALGVREVVVIPFDAAFAARSATAFVEDVLVGALGATHVNVGASFRFGRGGAGDVDWLRRDERFATRVVPLVRVGERVVSSTAVRQLVADGDVAGAAALLGGPVTVDVRLGRGGELRPTVGCALPGPGVYDCRLRSAAGGVSAAVVHVGPGGELRPRRVGVAAGRPGESLRFGFVRRLAADAAA